MAKHEPPAVPEHGVVVPPLPVPRLPGPPTVLTQTTADILIEASKQGTSRKGAAKAAGISVDVFYKWLRLGRAGDPQYRDFARAIDASEAKVEADLANALVAEGRSGNVAAAIGYLERRHPDRWGHRHTLEVKLKSEFEAFFAHLQAHLPANVFEQVLRAAALSGGDTPALPAAEVIDVEPLN